MPTSATVLPLLVAVHVAAAICLLAPSLLLPFALRVDGASARPPERGGVTRALLRLQAQGTLVLGGLVALSGLGLIVVLGPTLLQQPWLLVALAVYAADLLVAFFVQRPGVGRLLRPGAVADGAGGRSGRDVYRRQRYVSYAMAAAIGAIGFLMSTKPTLW
jgi:hypothetical protein